MLTKKSTAALFGMTLCASVPFQSRAGEANWWPILTSVTVPQSPNLQHQALGPLFFEETGNDGKRYSGLRPVLVTAEDPSRGARDTWSLYPLFSYHSDAEAGRWSAFSILRGTTSLKADPSGAKPSSFEIWPVYLSKNDPAKGDVYHAVFPLYGDVTNRFGDDKWTFRLFPLYSRSEANGRVVTQTPWPLIRRIEGGGHHGFEFFPLFGSRGRDGDYRSQFALWPLLYRQEKNLSAAKPTVRQGFLPFFAASDGPGEKSRTYVWPFFGYSDRTAPYVYHQTDYLWPFFVQGRGDQREVNRWAPFYTHSVIKGREKTWVAWPLWRQVSQREGNVQETETKVGLVVFKNTEQRSLTNPSAAPASKTHLWPLLSAWDNGAGKRQVQALSPFEPLFTDNVAVRKTWSPLFAVYRYNQATPQDYQHSLLWNLATYKRQGEARKLTVGPLLSTETGANANVTLGAGLIGVAKKADGSWSPFLFKFNRRKSAQTDAKP